MEKPSESPISLNKKSFKVNTDLPISKSNVTTIICIWRQILTGNPVDYKSLNLQSNWAFGPVLRVTQQRHKLMMIHWLNNKRMQLSFISAPADSGSFTFKETDQHTTVSGWPHGWLFLESNVAQEIRESIQPNSLHRKFRRC